MTCTCLLCLARLVQPTIELGNLAHPLLTLPVLQVQNAVQRPVEVIGDIGYLLVQAVEGVAYNPPASFARSTSNSPPQWGQSTARLVLPVSLIWR